MPAITRSATRKQIRPTLRYRPYRPYVVPYHPYEWYHSDPNTSRPKTDDECTLDELMHRILWQCIRVERTECDAFIVYKTFDRGAPEKHTSILKVL